MQCEADRLKHITLIPADVHARHICPHEKSLIICTLHLLTQRYWTSGERGVMRTHGDRRSGLELCL